MVGGASTFGAAVITLGGAGGSNGSRLACVGSGLMF